MYNSPGSYRGFSRDGLWRHCLATALTASEIARLTGKEIAEEAYVCGLLHHIGTILIDQYLRSHLIHIIDQVDGFQPTYLVERGELSFDQGQLGAYVLGRWHLPELVTHAVCCYRYPGAYCGPHRFMVHTAALADHLCSRGGLTSLGVDNTRVPGPDSYDLLGLEPEHAESLWKNLVPTFSDNPFA
jgi:HD-like signal output (HDOD) protein